ncbi:MAG: response regulator [Nitrospiraceae bacterium]|nr:MAG: response regulator [Nitrospiraceae bacterium]
MNTAKYGSVLVVDDDPDVLQSSSLLLMEHGYQTISASGAEEAILHFKTHSVDAVVSDIVMPHISGIELLRQIHHINPSTPVILMTAYADMDKVIDAIKIGAFDFIIKPFTADLLVHAVEKAVNFNRLMVRERDYRHLLEEYSQDIETLVAERTLSLMALTLADKIRNPSAVIGLICRRMLEKEDVPDRLRPKVEEIIDETKKLEVIVSDFHSLLKSKKSMFSYQDVNRLVEDVMRVSENMIARRGVELVFTPPARALKANIQRNLFQIALSHLVKNAAEATPPGGKISVSLYGSDDTVVIEVSDRGHGITNEDLENIFSPAFSSKDKRFGMGLPLVKQIVSEHLGQIEVLSRAGEGTTFRVLLPVRWSGPG